MNNQFYIETEVLFNEIYSKLVNDFSVTEIGKILESHIELLELTSKGRIDPIFIKIQIGSLNDLIDLKISSTHLIASMLYYLSLSENFHENYLEKFGPSIQTIVKDLINIGLYVERNNCWLENPNIKRPESKTSQLNNVRSKRWDKQTTANLPRMFLQIAKSDQTSIVKLIERLNILQYSQFFLSQEC
jgi:(p)ppGpp synthase/HD superfamily hydrolase